MKTHLEKNKNKKTQPSLLINGEKKKKRKIGEFSAKKLSGAQAISRKSNKTRQKNKTVNPK